jgi:hypothetical protein
MQIRHDRRTSDNAHFYTLEILPHEIGMARLDKPDIMLLNKYRDSRKISNVILELETLTKRIEGAYEKNK